MENSQNKSYIFEKISAFIVIALGFLMPVFYLTTTTEFYEFNKLALLVVGTVTLVIMWGLKVMRGGSIQFVKSTLDLPLVAYLLLTLVASLFALHKTTSIWGSQGRWFPSLMGILLLVAFYYTFANNFKDLRLTKYALGALIIGITINSTVATLGYFDIYFGQADILRSAGFNLTGSVTTSILLASLAAVMAIPLIYREKVFQVKILLMTTFLLNFVFIALTGTIMGWILFGLGLILSIISTDLKEIAEDSFSTMFLASMIIAIALITTLPATRDIISNPEYPYEVTLDVRDSWIVASSTIQNDPLIATGPSSFYINYTRYRPLTQNNEATWAARFDKPFNELFNQLSTVGIVGLIIYTILLAKAGKLALVNLKIRDYSGVVKTLSIGVVLLLVANLFTYATVLNSFVFFYLLGMLVAANSMVSIDSASKHSDIVEFSFASFSAVTTTIGETSAIRKEHANLIAVTPLLIAAVFGGYLFGKTYLAETYMRKAITAARENRAAEAYEMQAKAIETNPVRDSYHTAYAQTNLILANALAANPDLNDQDRQTIQTLVAQAIRSSRISTEVNNPYNVSNWQTRALIYRSLVNVADNAADWAVGSYNTAIQLDPTNPALRVDLGGVYFASEDYLSAANLFRQATVLKPDYANAHYNFAQALFRLNDIENARRELEVTKSLLAEGSEDYNRVVAEIDALTQLPEVAGATTETTRPTVEELTGESGLNQATPQEPIGLTEEQTINSENLSPEVFNPNSGTGTTNSGTTQPANSTP